MIAIIGPEVKIVSMLRSIAKLEPAICKLMENNAVMVMIPASKSLTPSFTWIKPVTNPATAPMKSAASSVTKGFTPLTA